MNVMSNRFPELVEAFRRRFEFVGLDPSKKNVVILANTQNAKCFIDAAYLAATTLGTKPTLIQVPFAPPNSSEISQVAEEAIGGADFFIDLMTLSWFYTQSRNRIIAKLAERGGILFPCSMTHEQDVHTYIANYPSPRRVERAERAKELINTTTEVRVTTEEGTDFTVERGDPRDNPIFLESLKHHISGKYGQAAFTPTAGTAKGIIRAVGGLRISSPVAERFLVREPVTFELDGGRIVDIHADTADGSYLKRWFASIGREDAYDFSHLNLGLVPLSMTHVDNEAVHMAYGGVLAGFGIRMTDWKPGVGGAPNHLDFWMGNASYYLDDMPLLKDGHLTEESGLALDPDELAAS